MITYLKTYLYCLTRKSSSGFTLVELIVASAMTLFVVSAAGYGAMVMLRENSAASIASDTQYNTNRAADFIADEVKSANSVLTSFTSATGCNTGDYTPILGIMVAGQANPIIYCLKAMSSSSDVWLGKNVIYRYGPPFNSDGSYSTSGTWTYEPLVDLIAESPQSSTCQNTGWTKIPSGTPKGFFVCIEPTNQKMVELHLSASAMDINASKAQTTTWMSPGPTSRLGDKAMYEVITQAFVRAPSELALSVSATSVAKGNTVTFTFKRAGDISKAITINFTLSGTAVNGTSYSTLASPGTVSMAANASSATQVVSTLSGATAGQTVILTIIPGTGYAIGGTSAQTVTITN